MSKQDKDIEWLKANVSCAVLLERLPPVWRLDRAESSRASPKYRRGEGEILIVNHNGRGWWDPLSDCKGDIFTLMQHIQPGLSFNKARHVLREFAGVAPTFPEAHRVRQARASALSVVQRWDRCPPLSDGSPAWLYLAAHRKLPERILIAARKAAAIREGPHGSAWFAHRDAAGCLTGIEMRGPDYRDLSAGGTKTLFRPPGGPGSLPRVALCEGSIDALSLAAIERSRDDTLYAATAGGMGPETVGMFQRLFFADSGDRPGRHADRRDGRRHYRPASCRPPQRSRGRGGVRFDTILPPDGLNDWNDVLRAMTPVP
jgi:hypothetical protein